LLFDDNYNPISVNLNLIEDELKKVGGKLSTNYLQEINMKLCGNLVLKDGKYYVFKGKFEASLSKPNQFRKLASYLKNNLHIDLLEKQPEVVPLWPPCIRRGDTYEVIGRNTELTCSVISGNDDPKVFIYQDSNIHPGLINLQKSDSGINTIKFKVNNNITMINVDRKRAGTGTYFKNIELNMPQLSYEIAEKDLKGQLTDVQGLCEIRTDLELHFQTASAVEVIKIDGKNHISQFRNTSNQLDLSDLKYKETIVILSHQRIIYQVYIEKRLTDKSKLYWDDKELFCIAEKHDRDNRIIVPFEVRRLLQELIADYNISRSRLCQYLVDNTIPASVSSILLGGINQNDL